MPPKNAPPAQERAIARQNETASSLAKAGYDIEQLPNTRKNVANPDLKINGVIADVYSPVTSSTISVLKTIDGKVKKQASTIVVNLDDSVITISQLRDVLRLNPVQDLRKLYVVKNGEIVEIEI